MLRAFTATTRLAATLGASIVIAGNAHAADASPASSWVRLGPSCRVHYRESIQQLAETLAPAIQLGSRVELAAAGQAWNARHFSTGLASHTGPVTTHTTDLTAQLPAGVPLPPSLEVFEFAFVHPGDPRSERLLALRSQSVSPDLSSSSSPGAPCAASSASTAPPAPRSDESQPRAHRQTVVFFTDVTGSEFRAARGTLPSTLRAAFPASAAWARFLGVDTYPALVQVRRGIAHAIAGDLTEAELASRGF